MMIRSTTNGVLKSYRYNLQRSSYTLNKAMNTVLTGRNFDTYAADPATAARCFCPPERRLPRSPTTVS